MVQSSPTKITTIDVNARSEAILNSLVNASDFEFNILLKQLSNWTPAKRRQTFRIIFKKLFTEIQSFQWEYLDKSLRQHNLHWYSMKTDFIIVKMLDKFINGIMRMDENERFVPEKVYTLPRLNIDMLLIDPKLLNYLLVNNIIVLGTKFSISGSGYQPLHTNMRTFRYQSRDFKQAEKVYKGYGMDTDIIFNPTKTHLIIMSRVMENLNNIFSFTIINDNEMTPRNIQLYQQITTIFRNLIQSAELPLSKLANSSKADWEKILKNVQNEYPDCLMLEAEFMHSNNRLITVGHQYTTDMDKVVQGLIDDKIKTIPEFKGEAFDPTTAII